ncbi:hypothetical protein [Pyrofollis japonicus]|uniref:hypothetical protein n=1 Tax=Pyrofollis japonicus TaxID=3060460 RepID=UPI00295B6300|nr:hypothetical protein [Pyrofollis japonicus]
MMRIPSWCKPALNTTTVLPGDIVINISNGGVSAVVRRVIGGFYLVVPKYVFGQGPWRFLGESLERLLSSYAPGEVYRAARRSGFLSYVAQYGRDVPLISVGPCERNVIVCSGKLFADMFYRIRGLDYLEVWIEAVSELRDLVGSGVIECLRPTGSLLMGSFMEFSDIDVVFDIASPWCYERLIELVEAAEEKRVPVGERFLSEEYVLHEASSRHIPLGVARRVLRPWTRLRLAGREASISVLDSQRRTEEERRVWIITSEVTETRVSVEPYDARLGDFPGIVETKEGYIVVFDGFYVPALFEGGRFRVRGLKARIVLGGGDSVDAIAVGVAEASTFVEPLS